MLEKIDKKSNNMIKNFVNAIGLDGDYYVSTMYYHVIYSNIKRQNMFLSPNAESLKKELDNTNYSERMKKKILREGAIIIGSEYNINLNNKDLFITLVHEKFHANRMLISSAQRPRVSTINGVSDYKDHVAVNTGTKRAHYFDANQEIYHGSIDTSRKAINHFRRFNRNKMVDLYEGDEKVHEAYTNYQLIDEALVELMAILSYSLYVDNSTDVVEKLYEIIDDDNMFDDIRAMARIIIRHNDFDLFKWMIDPLTYQLDDINYDFFSNYVTDEDIEDCNVVYGHSFYDEKGNIK